MPDTGRDGYDITHLIDLSDAGSWADILPFCVNIKIIPDLRFERLSDAGEGGHHARPANIAFPFHAEPIATTDKDNPHAR